MMEGMKREPVLLDFEASWSGLAIAEAALLANRSAVSLKMAGCLATASFAIGRASALWPQVKIDEVLHRYVECNQLIRGTSFVNVFIERLGPIWSALCEAAQGGVRSVGEPTKMIQALLEVRSSLRKDEHKSLWSAMGAPHEYEYLFYLDNISPENRVNLFDHLIDELRSNNRDKREVVAFLAGYIATVAAGGLPSMSLAEHVADEWPEVLAWAYVIGGIGERITWSSSFGGLGRLVCRELTRPFHIDETPTCDFSFDEASCLVDRDLADPFVHLKIKQQRTVSVAILPGINVGVPLLEAQEVRPVVGERPAGGRVSKETARIMSDLWPLIEARLRDEGYIASSPRSSGRKKPTQGRLPYER
jgi:hypothetical protein